MASIAEQTELHHSAEPLTRSAWAAHVRARDSVEAPAADAEFLDVSESASGYSPAQKASLASTATGEFLPPPVFRAELARPIAQSWTHPLATATAEVGLPKAAGVVGASLIPGFGRFAGDAAIVGVIAAQERQWEERFQALELELDRTRREFQGATESNRRDLLVHDARLADLEENAARREIEHYGLELPGLELP